MLIVIIAILILLIIGLNLADLDDWSVAPAIILLVAVVVEIFLVVKVQKASVIDEQIAMYQEENSAIEGQISAAIAAYQGYESETLKGLMPEDSVYMVLAYPELKSDALVEKQLEVYMSNNEKIKELKNKKIQIKVDKWWCYFGK